MKSVTVGVPEPVGIHIGSFDPIAGKTALDHIIHQFVPDARSGGDPPSEKRRRPAQKELFGEGDFAKSCTRAECIFLNDCQILRPLDVLELQATLKSALGNTCYSIRNNDFFKSSLCFSCEVVINKSSAVVNFLLCN